MNALDPYGQPHTVRPHGDRSVLIRFWSTQERDEYIKQLRNKEQSNADQ